MSPERLELALRRQRLQLQAMAQRQELHEQLRPFLPAFAAADRVQQGVSWVRHHPQILLSIGTVVLVAALVAKPRRVWRWARRGFSAWRLWQRFDTWQQGFGAKPASHPLHF